MRRWTALIIVLILGERQSPTRQTRWLKRYLTKGSPRLEHFAAMTASLAMRNGRDREPPAERGSSGSDPRRVAEGLTGRGIGNGLGNIQCREHSDRTACFGDHEVRNAVTRHEFRGIGQPGVGADEDCGSTRASRRALILKASYGRSGHEIQVRDDSPQRADLDGCSCDHDAVQSTVRHELRDLRQGRAGRDGDYPRVHRFRHLRRWPFRSGHRCHAPNHPVHENALHRAFPFRSCGELRYASGQEDTRQGGAGRMNLGLVCPPTSEIRSITRIRYALGPAVFRRGCAFGSSPRAQTRDASSSGCSSWSSRACRAGLRVRSVSMSRHLGDAR